MLDDRKGKVNVKIIWTNINQARINFNVMGVINELLEKYYKLISNITNGPQRKKIEKYWNQRNKHLFHSSFPYD